MSFEQASIKSARINRTVTDSTSYKSICKEKAKQAFSMILSEMERDYACRIADLEKRNELLIQKLRIRQGELESLKKELQRVTQEQSGLRDTQNFDLEVQRAEFTRDVIPPYLYDISVIGEQDQKRLQQLKRIIADQEKTIWIYTRNYTNIKLADFISELISKGKREGMFFQLQSNPFGMLSCLIIRKNGRIEQQKKINHDQVKKYFLAESPSIRHILLSNLEQ